MKYLTFAAATLVAAPAFAEAHLPGGDAAAGEEAFNRQCVTCHVVVDPAGEKLAGRNARTGPNLYGVAMRTPGKVEGFRYSDSVVELGESGAVWDEANFSGYVQDPTGWLKEALDDSRARGKMAFKVRSEEDAANLYAYLHSLAPPTEDGMSAAAGTEILSN